MCKLLFCHSCVASTPNAQIESFGARLASALDVGEPTRSMEVQAVDCLGACAQPIAIGLQGSGMASYVFSGITGLDEIPDIVRTCQIYLNSPEGWIEDARSCGRLRHLLRARLPALT